MIGSRRSLISPLFLVIVKEYATKGYVGSPGGFIVAAALLMCVLPFGRPTFLFSVSTSGDLSASNKLIWSFGDCEDVSLSFLFFVEGCLIPAGGG